MSLFPTPEELAEEARDALRRRTETPGEHFDRLVRQGWVAGAEPHRSRLLADLRRRGDAPVANPLGHRRDDTLLRNRLAQRGSAWSTDLSINREVLRRGESSGRS